MVRYAILGPIQLCQGERSLPVGGPRQVRLLGFFLVHPNRAVSADELLDALWGEQLRPGAIKRLRMAVARLRKTLEVGATGAEPPLRTLAGGYLFDVRPGELDSDVFAALVEDGRRALDRTDVSDAVKTLRAALALWRGPALAEVGYEAFAQAEIRRLEALRLTALEARIDAELQLGRHTGLISEIEALAVSHPTRERFAAQLMLALYRCGRQVDALDVYQRTRVELSTQLGLEPGPALRALQAEVLVQARSLELVADSPGSLHDESRAPRDAGTRGSPVLLYRDDEGRQRVFELSSAGSRITIGRRSTRDISLEWDPEVSRTHAQLERIDDDWVIVDDGLSRNGSYVNHRRLAGRRRLRDGDMLRIGDTVLSYRDPDEVGMSTAAAKRAPELAELSELQRRILVALCRPFKDGGGLPSPATDREIAEEIAIGVDAVQSQLQVLAGDFGIAHMPLRQKRVALADEALRLGVVSFREL